jgi:hypothetical protein
MRFQAVFCIIQLGLGISFSPKDKPEITIDWTVNDGEIKFTSMFPKSGWVSVGWKSGTSSSTMIGADVVVGCTSSVSNPLTTRKLRDYTSPPADRPFIGELANEEKSTRLSFSLNSSDLNFDPKENFYLLWAYSDIPCSSNNFLHKHVDKGIHLVHLNTGSAEQWFEI